MGSYLQRLRPCARQRSAQLRRWSVLLLAGMALLAPHALAAEERSQTTHDGWAFQPVQRPPVPQVHNAAWVRTPVDAFVLARLERAGLEPAGEADRRTLLRRVTFDLTGLPPTPEEVQSFQQDTGAGAYERVVERLLASPHYGERWAQHWLDVVRYADSDGFEYDDPRPNAWRYRDWVIRSFNQDKPYDRFVQEQIAGDELFPGNLDALVATGVHRLAPLRLNAGNQDEEKNRQEVLTEMTDCIGSAFLGVTLGCARCHDHKFDPIRQADYYQMEAFFAATVAKDVPLVSPEEQEAHRRALQAWKEQVAAVKKRIARLQQAEQGAPGEEDRQQLTQLRTDLSKLQEAKPAELAAVMAVSDTAAPAPATYVLRRGQPGQHMDEVGPAFPVALAEEMDPSHAAAADFAGAPSDSSAGRRSALAEWLTAPENPLPARVMVNRIWQHHFGEGLVATPNDFGAMGQPPTHPELLDWLASEFVARGWSIKEMHRRIVLSATYRQAGRSAESEKAARVDPQNKLLWHMPRRRLDAEELRDSILAVAGTLNRKRGGPGVFVPLNDEVTSLIYKGSWEATPDPAEYTRRTIYLFVKRNLRPPMLEAFDAPSTMVSCARRSESTHAGQSLAMLNGSFADEQSWALAVRLMREVGCNGSLKEKQNFAAIVDRAYWLALARAPQPAERDAAVRFLREQTASHKERVANEPIKVPVELPGSTDPNFATALADFCLVMLNLDEFTFVE